MIINLTEYFERTVSKFPSRIAVVEGDSNITFLQLHNKVFALAEVLSERLGNSLNKLVGVYLPKSINSVKANLAISYSANFYMNLDIKSPEARIKGILDLNRPALVISDTANIKKLKDMEVDILILNVDEISELAKGNIDKILERVEKLIDTDPLCVINTSGSTGIPKGVILNHRSFIDFIEWSVDTLGISENEIVGSLSPLVFDIYSFELCMLMARASTIVLIPENQTAFPANILKLIDEKRISFIFWVPTIMVNIANMGLLKNFELPSLKTIWFAGEVFPTKQFNHWRRHLSNTKFINLYGPIEITLDCTYFIVDREIKDDETIPIGFPCRNTSILILNDENALTTINELGELCIRGSSLAMGYYNNPEKTLAVFVQNPLNNSYPEIIYRTGDIVYLNDRNEIIFKGRKDSLVKHLGYRIELGEIEHVVINKLNLVKNGCVVYNFSKKEIVLYYESGEKADISDMRKKISEIFPKYMIPSNYIKMDELPRNANGKIDRLLLSNKLNQG